MVSAVFLPNSAPFTKLSLDCRMSRANLTINGVFIPGGTIPFIVSEAILASSDELKSTNPTALLEKLDVCPLLSVSVVLFPPSSNTFALKQTI